MFDASGAPVHFTLTRTTDAAAEPLTTAEAKLFLRVDHSTDDTLIDALVKAARQQVQADTGRALVNETWTMTLDVAPSGGAPILVPIAPLSSVTSITAYATDDTSSTVATSVYRVDTASVPGRIVLKDGQSWPSGLRPKNALSVVCVAGYGASASAITDVPLVQAVRVLVAHWYTNRESVVVGSIATEVPQLYQALVAPFRVAFR